MKHIITFILIILGFYSQSQVITTKPEFPIASQPDTIIFNATGTNLDGYTGNVYAHTGVTIEGVGQWQHVIGTWGDNSAQPQLTNLGNNIYELDIIPTINDFYTVPGGEVVTEQCFVFRSADGSKQTSDLFINVYSETDINITAPDSARIFSSGETVTINAVSIFATSMSLYINNNLITTVSANQLTYDYTAATSGINTIRIEATDGTTSVQKESHFFVRADNTIADLPTSNLKDGINYIDDNTVTLVLYAPFKDFAFVKGSFDNWALSLSNQMNKTPDGNRYWITLTGLTSGQEYVYQYIVDGTLTIADPYCDKISDPWNDQYISNTTYPNLISYPSGKTSGIASVFQTAQTPYSWKNTNFTRPDSKDLIIYELLVRDFVAAHDYQTLIDTINYLKNLGINAIELMPVSEFEGNSSWGYNPDFYFAPDKYYGTKNKLKEFIDTCHAKNIAVIMDMVLNHSYGQSPLVQLYFDPNAGEWGQPTAENPWYNQTSPNPDYSWGYDFNHESPDTKAFVYRVCNYWLTDYKFDGFRFDFTKGFTNTPGNGWAYDASRIAILKDYADHIWASSPGAYFILEHFTDNSEETELANYGMMLWGNMNYSYSQASMGWSNGWDFSETSYKQRGWNNPNLVSYMESHDEERMMYRNETYGNSSGSYNIKNEATALRRAELAGAFFFTIPGPKMIWQFEELGYDISIDDPCRVCEKPILWNYFSEQNRKKLYEYFKIFINLKKNYPVFSTSDYDISFSGNMKQIVLRSAGLNVVILGNFDVTEHYAVPDFSASSVWYDYYTHEEYSGSNSVTLAPGEYKIFTSEMLDIPDIPETVNSLKDEDNKLTIYPNPSVDKIFIPDASSFSNIEIINIQGKQIINLPLPYKNEINISFLQSGIYFIKAEKEGRIYYEKFIKL
ncbi:MAG: T9SS type A sorting domain-containing protein [Bacteroidales bacterium]|nr:T9SS type A sorting domain-containing protein [Bacteroidales bacterium]